MQQKTSEHRISGQPSFVRSVIAAVTRWAAPFCTCMTEEMISMTQASVKRCAAKDDMFILAEATEALLSCGKTYTDMRNLIGKDANQQTKAVFQE